MRWGRRTKSLRSQLSTDVREIGTSPPACFRLRVISHLLHNGPSHGFAAVPEQLASSYGMRTAQPYFGRGALPVLSLVMRTLFVGGGRQRPGGKKAKKSLFLTSEKPTLTMEPFSSRAPPTRNAGTCDVQVALSNLGLLIVDGGRRGVIAGRTGTASSPRSNGLVSTLYNGPVDVANKCQRVPRAAAAPRLRTVDPRLSPRGVCLRPAVMHDTYMIDTG